MSITSPVFLAFVAGVAAFYWLLPLRFQRLWLLLASYAFYATWALEFAVTLALLSLANYAIGLRVAGRRGWLWFGIALNLLALAFFKYSGFFLARWPLGEGLTLQILLPVGLSFLVLQAISYLIDVQRGQFPAERSLPAFALYLAYFPKLLSGPIERAKTFLPLLARPQVVTNAVLAQAFTRILVGFFRKKFLGDSLLLMIDPAVWRAPQEFSAAQLAVWLLAFAFGLYNDFAGYTSIARGVSLLFGIELTPNFQQPYFARNLTEFWNRWHRTLSHWLRDYIYFPLARALRQRGQGAAANLILPPLVTMLVSGLWHGASWNMLFWGGLHGVYQIAERLPTLWRPAVPPEQQPRGRQVLGALVTFALVVLAWLPFQLPLPEAGRYLLGLFSGGAFWLDGRVLALVALTLGLDVVQARAGEDQAFLGWPLPARAAVLAFALLALLFVFQADAKAPFIYQGF